MSQKRRKSRVAFGSLVLTALSLIGASGGSCPGGFAKSNSALAPISVAGDSSALTQCGTFASYHTSVEPILQKTCVSCHGPGGKGAAHWQLQVGDASSAPLAANNFSVAKVSALPPAPIDTATLENTSPLLERISGKLTHDITLGVASDDYLAIYTWVASEAAAPCVVDPATGQVTSGGVDPSASPSP